MAQLYVVGFLCFEVCWVFFFLFNFCYLCVFYGFVLFWIGFFCSWVVFCLNYCFIKNKIIITVFLGGVKFYFPLCFCDLGKGLLFGFQETAGFICCWCWCWKELSQAELSCTVSAGVEWGPLFSQSFLMELLTFTGKSLLNIGEKKVRDGGCGEVTRNCELKCYLLNKTEFLKSSVPSAVNESHL